MLPFALAAALLATPARADGVLVGHPVDFRIAPAAGLVFDTLELTVSHITVDFCGTTTAVTYDVGEEYGLGDALLLPAGRICGVLASLSHPTVVTGHGTGGGTFTIELALAQIAIPVDPGVTVTGTSSDAYAIELASPGWTSASALGVAPNTHTSIVPSSTIHAALRVAWRDGSTLLR